MHAEDLLMIPIAQSFQVRKLTISAGLQESRCKIRESNLRRAAALLLRREPRHCKYSCYYKELLLMKLNPKAHYPLLSQPWAAMVAQRQKGKEVLEHYGITEETMGAPIISTMDVVSIPNEDNDFKLYMSRDAYEADRVIVINRVKPHTDFHGPVESGLMKMCVIGLGKHAQALEMHRLGVYGLRELVPKAARKILATGKILLGIGIVENALDQTLAIKAADSRGIEALDAELLDLARKNMPSLPIDRLDLLIVDQLGKDKSGTGLDTNIIGRMGILGQEEPEVPNISYIIACSLTKASGGNALGMGLADFITQDFYNDIDFAVTYENVMTSSFIKRGRMPMVARDDAQAIEWALRAMGPRKPEDILAMSIPSTLELGELQVSPAALERIMKDPVYKEREIRILGEAEPILNKDGRLKTL